MSRAHYPLVLLHWFTDAATLRYYAGPVEVIISWSRIGLLIGATLQRSNKYLLAQQQSPARALFSCSVVTMQDGAPTRVRIDMIVVRILCRMTMYRVDNSGKDEPSYTPPLRIFSP